MKLTSLDISTAHSGSRLDEAIARHPGMPLQPTHAAHAVELAPIEGDVRTNVIKNLGLGSLVDGRSVSQIKRAIAEGVSQLDAVPVLGSVAEVAAKLGLPISSQAMIDRARGDASNPPAAEIEARIAQATEALGAVTAKLGTGQPPAIDTAKLPEAPGVAKEVVEQREIAWSLYQTAKGSLQAGLHELAEAQLELAAAHNLKYFNLAMTHDGFGAYGTDATRLEVMRSQNRMGMVVHQFGLLANARGDQQSHVSSQIKALRWYSDVTSGKNIDHYQPAAFLNSACAYAQLGDLDRGLTALSDMLSACKDDKQRSTMKKVAREDAELLGLYQGHERFVRLTAE